MGEPETRRTKSAHDIVGYLICAWIVVGYIVLWLTEAWPNRQAPEPIGIFSDVVLLFFPNNLLALVPGLSRGFVFPLMLLGVLDVAFMLALTRFKPLADIKPAWKLWIYLVFSAASSFVVMKVFFNYMFLRPSYP